MSPTTFIHGFVLRERARPEQTTTHDRGYLMEYFRTLQRHSDSDHNGRGYEPPEKRMAKPTQILQVISDAFIHTPNHIRRYGHRQRAR